MNAETLVVGSGRAGDPTPWIGIALAAMATLLAVWVLSAHLVMLWLGYTPVFEADQWDTVPMGRSWAALFAQHNEHRIFFPRLFLIADTDWFSGRGLFALSVTFASQAVYAAAFVLLARDAIRSDGGAVIRWIPVYAVIVALMFANVQMQNSLLPFQIPFVLVHAAPALGLWLLTRCAAEDVASRPRGADARLALAVACFIVATFTMANGLPAFVVAVVLAWLLRLRARHVATLAVIGALAIAGYLHGFMRPGQHDYGRSFGLSAAAGMVEFAAVYLGHPVAAMLRHLIGPWAGASTPAGAHIVDAILGAIALVAMAALAVDSVWRRMARRAPNPPIDALVMFGAFILLGAAMTAFGRVGMGLEQATVSRYATPALGLWTVLWIAGWSRFMRLRAAPPIEALMAAASMVILITVAASQTRAWDFATNRRLTLERIGTGITSGLFVNEVWAALTHARSAFPDRVRYLRDRRLSIFATDRGHWFGTRLGERLVAVDGARCAGNFDVLTPLADDDGRGGRIEGWGWDRTAAAAPRGVIVVGRDGVVVGSAAVGIRRPDVPAAVREVTTARVGWSGYAAFAGAETLTAYAVLADGRSACPLTTPRSSPGS